MTDYKTIKGKRVKFFETDLSGGEAEGQLFFSDTSKEMKIAIVGAGAMGSMVGGLLALSGEDVHLVDLWKKHVNTIRHSGLTLVEGKKVGGKSHRLGCKNAALFSMGLRDCLDSADLADTV